MAESTTESGLAPGDLVVAFGDHAGPLSNVLTVEKGDTLTVVSIDGSGFWAWCRNSSGTEGHVPAAFLRKVLVPTKDNLPSPSSSTQDPASTDDSSISLSPAPSPPSSPSVAQLLLTGKRELCFRTARSYRCAWYRDLTVVQGEILQMLSEPSDDLDVKCLVQSVEQPNRRGYVPRAILVPIKEHDFEPWFMGKIPRMKTEQLLMNPRLPLHMFLIRESESSSGYVISIKSKYEDGEAMIRHRKISETNGKFSAWAGHEFSNLCELVASHTTSEGDNHLGEPFNKNKTLLPKLGLSSLIQSSTNLQAEKLNLSSEK